MWRNIMSEMKRLLSFLRNKTKNENWGFQRKNKSFALKDFFFMENLSQFCQEVLPNNNFISVK
jgi:hypothetical protein